MAHIGKELALCSICFFGCIFGFLGILLSPLDIRDIAGNNQQCFSAAKMKFMPGGFYFNDLSILTSMLRLHFRRLARLNQFNCDPHVRHCIVRPDIRNAHVQKFFARIAVMF